MKYCFTFVPQFSNKAPLLTHHIMITTVQYDSLVQNIYNHLIGLADDSGNQRGMGEMGDTRDEARGIVDEWIESQHIQIV